MKTSIAILSALVLSVVMTRAEEAGKGKNHEKHNPHERFAKADTDGNGSLSLAEFQATPRGKENPERAAEVFKKIDTDGSGGVSPEEMMKFVKEHVKNGDGPHGKRPDGAGGQGAAGGGAAVE